GTVILSPDRTIRAVPPPETFTVWVEGSQAAPALAAADQAKTASGAARPAATVSTPASRRVRGYGARWRGRRCMTTKTLWFPLQSVPRKPVGIGFDAAKGVACPKRTNAPAAGPPPGGTFLHKP